MNNRKHLKIIVLVLLLLSISLTGQSQAANIGRKVIAVMPFENLQNDPEINWLSRGVQDTLITKLSKVEALRLVERGRLSDVVGEKVLRLVETGRLVDVARELELAQLEHPEAKQFIGAEILLLGSFAKVGDIVQLTARFVEVETAAITQGALQQGPINEIFKLIDKLGFDLLSHLQIKTTGEMQTRIAENPTEAIGAYEYFGKSLEFYDFDKRNGDIDLAIRFLQKAIELDPNYVSAYSHLGLAYYYKGEIDQAIRILRHAIDLNPNYADAYLNLGVVHYAAKEYEQAIKIAEKAILLRPDFATAHQNLAEIYRAAGLIDKALQSYAKLFEIQGPTAVAYKGVGGIFLDLKEYDKAMTAYTKAAFLRPEHETYLMMGVIFYNQGKYDESIGAYLRSLQLQETYQAYNNLGNAYLKRGEVEKAITAYLKMIELEPNVPDAHYNLGYAYAEQGNMNGAIDAYLKAIHLNPKYTKAHYGLAQACRAKGDFDEKLMDSYQKEASIDANEGLYYYYMGMSYAMRGLADDAASFLKRAFQLDDKYRRRAHTDTAFDIIRPAPVFQKLMNE